MTTTTHVSTHFTTTAIPAAVAAGIATHVTTTANPAATAAGFAGPFDLGTQAGILTGAFFACVISTALFAMLLFNMISLRGLCACGTCCGGGCEMPAVGESCLVVFCKWAVYKYCPWCCKNYRRKLMKQMEKLKREEEEMEFEMMRMEREEEEEKAEKETTTK